MAPMIFSAVETSQRGNPLVAAFRAMAGGACRGQLSAFLVLCRIAVSNEQNKARNDKGAGELVSARFAMVN